MRIIVALGLALLAAACGWNPLGSSDAGDADGLLSAAIAGSTLRMESHAGTPLYYLAYRDGVLAQFARCLAPACPAVPPGGVVFLPLDSLTGWDAEARAVRLEYWNLIHDTDGYRADSVRTLVVSH
ncbi:MAG: hypothetical protein P8174_12230 [Gemmatimonadota bacterium]